MAKAKPAPSTPPNTSQDFDSLVLALDGWFEHNLEDIPEALQRRIV